MELYKNDRGLYEMYINDEFIGYFKTPEEAAHEYDRIRNEERKNERQP